MSEQFDARAVTEFENKTWSRCAESYLQGFGQLVVEAIDPLLNAADIGPEKKVLDVGTGPGLTAAAAGARGAEAIGIDFSEQMLAEARRLYPKIDFRQAAADQLPFDEEEFDAVIGNFILHHAAFPERVLSEAHRVLRTGGKIGFTVWADMAKLAAFGLFFAAVEEHAGAGEELPHGPLFGVADPDVFDQMCREAGFQKPEVRELDIAWRTDSIETLIGAFRDWANLAEFPAEMRSRIEETVRRNSAAFKTGEIYLMPNPALLITAEK